MTSAIRIAPSGASAGAEDVEPARGAVDEVDDVVQPGGEEVDVLPVERGDEHPVEPGDDLVGDLVGQVLQPLDLIHDGGALRRVGRSSSCCRPAASAP